MHRTINFKLWSETAVSEYTCEWGGGGECIRDVYTLPNGVKIHDEVCMPRSIFRPQTQQTLVDIIFPESKKAWLAEQGAEFETERYTEDGFGYPLFVGENSTERAFEFAMKLKEAEHESARQTGVAEQ